MSNTPATAEQAAEAIYKQLNSGTMYKEKVLDILEKGLEDFAKRNHLSKQVEQPSQVPSDITVIVKEIVYIARLYEGKYYSLDKFQDNVEALLRDRIKPKR